jgi:thiamine-monophosphate kinase
LVIALAARIISPTLSLTELIVPRPSEDELIAKYFAPLAGPGGLRLSDDAALLSLPSGEEFVLTKDMLVAGVHFFADDPPDAIARKALRVNLSDLAAKGAKPVGFLLGLGLPSDWTEDWLKVFAAGLAEDAHHFAIPLLGGDTVAAPVLTLSVTALGSVPAGKMVQRTAAQAGDRLFVSGTIGDAALGLKLRWNADEDRAWIGRLSPEDHAHLVNRYLLPRPRLGLCAALMAHARAAMDISDGFAGDLSKMLRLAGLTADIDAKRVPLSEAARMALAIRPELLSTMLCGGDDYEILCAIPPEATAAFVSEASNARIAVTEIGMCAEGDCAVEVRDAKGQVLSFEAGSFQHF